MIFPDNKSYEWFEKHTANIIKHCRRNAAPAPGFSDEPLIVYQPGGDDKYPGFWVRDAAMECRSGFIPAEEMEVMARLTLSFQNGPECRKLDNRLYVTPWAVPDHINLPGLGNEEFRKRYQPGAVFFPGTYSPSDDQGTGDFGLRPADDDIYEVVQMVFTISSCYSKSRAVTFLKSRVKDIPVLERLNLGFKAIPVDGETGLHWNTPADWSASNFHDALRPMGAISLTSCLRYRAARQMAELFNLTGNTKNEEEYRQISKKLAKTVSDTFQRKDGWLLAATQVNRQPDTWTTAMACYYGLLEKERGHAASCALAKSLKDGSLAINGYIRHTPVWADDITGRIVWEDERMDERTRYGSYQFGGYWPQPLGYICWSVALTDRPLAVRTAKEFVEHTVKHEGAGSPFEWINPAVIKNRPGEGKWYGPSAALPLESFHRLSQGK
jgi:hypothetical protein